MSFASEVKNELSRRDEDRRCCRRALLAALLKGGAALVIGKAKSGPGLIFSTANAAVARRVLVLLKTIGNTATELTISRTKQLKKRTRYEIAVPPQEAVTAMIASLGLLPGQTPILKKNFLQRPCCETAYLKGAFLATGTVNRPGASYHLEIGAADYQYANFLLAVLKRAGFAARLTDRKDAYLVYLKEADAICDFLTVIGAGDAAEEFTVARNLKEVRNQANRLVNCETANLEKTAAAAAKQIAAINILKTSPLYAKLPKKINAAIKARMEHPDVPLSELAAILKISKSGVNHRMKKIVDLAETLSTQGVFT